MGNNILFKSRNYNQIKIWENVSELEWNDYKWQLKNSIKSIEQLQQVIELNSYQIQEISKTINKLRKQGKEPLRITPYYASLMNSNPFNSYTLKGQLNIKRIDPIFWQSVITPANLLFPNTGVEGSMKEETRSFGAVYQRYPNRVALFVGQNTNCASYCVHCQRSKSLDCNNKVDLVAIKKGLFYIAYNKNIDEVLITGGDALMIDIERLKYVLEELSKIPNVRSIRIATRTPVVLPMIITDELLETIRISANKYNKSIEKYVYFMTHINHYNEITKELHASVKKILSYGFTVRNQTVLLNHVNDSYQILGETFRRMFWIGVHPYYLLQCHKEKGIVHFISPIQVGKIFIKHLQGWISGVCIPKYAVNIEGGGGKVLLMHSGHDTLNIGNDIEKIISESYATVDTWDDKHIYKYEALGRATIEEYENSMNVMNKFIGREGVFKPRIIIIDDEGNHLFTTNRKKLPQFDNKKKSKYFGYLMQNNNFPLTNPFLIESELEAQYTMSNSAVNCSHPIERQKK